jgi:tRNA(Ile)-lysidine synthase TilS/MesJ
VVYGNSHCIIPPSRAQTIALGFNLDDTLTYFLNKFFKNR